MAVRFANPWSIPPGGYFFEIDGDRAEGRSLPEMRPKVEAILARHGRAGESVELALANYMCPRLGRAAAWLCAGDFKAKSYVRPADALSGSARYATMPVAPFDAIQRRVSECMKCPKHERAWCTTCNGHLDRVIAMFGRSRPRLPLDAGAGVCTCAKAYVSAVASPAYGPDDKVWEGTPATCWRFRDV